MCVIHVCCCCCRRLPQPGEGPSRDVMMNGYWKHEMIGLTEEQPGQQPQVGRGGGLQTVLTLVHVFHGHRCLNARCCIDLNGCWCIDFTGFWTCTCTDLNHQGQQLQAGGNALLTRLTLFHTHSQEYHMSVAVLLGSDVPLLVNYTVAGI